MRISASAAKKKFVAAICYGSLAGAMPTFAHLPVVMTRPGLNRTRADIQCLIVGARLSESASPTVKLSGGMVMTYFLGRLDGRTPDANIESLIIEELRTMTSGDVAEASRRCTDEFSKRGVEFEKIGNALVRNGR